jgi:hypothetical protein
MTLSRSRSVVACFTFDCGRPHAPTTANPTTISRILRIFATPNGVVKGNFTTARNCASVEPRVTPTTAEYRAAGYLFSTPYRC